MAWSARLFLLMVVFLGCLPAPMLWADPPAPAEAQPSASPPAEAKPAETAPAQADDATKKSAVDETYQLQRLLVDTLDQIERSYVKDISRRQLVEAAIRGLLRELDPYSDYISPDELKQFQSTVEAEFGGIGIQITIDDGQLKVMSPLVGTPAYRAGLIAGDAIVEIDGKSTVHITIDDAVRQLKGEPGSKVVLTIVHPGKTARETVELTREVIHIETVLGDRRKPDDTWDFMLDPESRIGYIRLTGFSRDTASELDAALEELKKEGMRGLILDLRFNPGGLLTAAIEISDLFVSSGRIVSTQGRNAEERVWEAHKEGTFEGFPMVVLVNRFTASASEIVSACLQDHKRAVIMGERTWGKGSVQNVIPLEEQRSALKLTTASYRRPSGKNIHRFPDAKESDEWGVMPDMGYELKLDDGEMLALIDDRRQRDVVQPKQVPTTTAENPQPKDQPAAAPSEPVSQSPAPAAPAPAAASVPASPEQKQDTPAMPEREETKTDQAPEEKPAMVDPQLRMAIDYLTDELKSK